MNRRTFLKLGLTGAVLSFAPKAWALKYFPNPSKKKWAVLYATWCGTSRDTAIWISEGMGGIADVFDVRENPDLNSFDNVVIGSSIRGFTIHPELEEYLNKNKGKLKKKIRGYFAACNNMGQPPGPKQKTDYIDNKLAKICGVSKVPGKVFPGRITKDLLDEQNRKIFASFPDSDNLKRPDCLAFGKEILASMK